MRAKFGKRKASKIDIVNYNYLKSLPNDRKNLITAIEKATLEKKYPELKA